MADPWDIRERRQMANLRSKQNKIKKALAERKAAETAEEREYKPTGPSSDSEELPGLWVVANHLAAKIHRKRFNAEKNEIARLGRKMLKIKKARAKRGAPEIVSRQDKHKMALAKKKISKNASESQEGNKEEIKDTKGNKRVGRPPGSKNKQKDKNSAVQNKLTESKNVKGESSGKNKTKVTKSELPISSYFSPISRAKVNE